MSFLIDPPWLYANGKVLAKLPEKTHRPIAGATMGVFLATSISLYLNARWTKPIWEACKADDGRDWMLNSGVFRFDHEHVSPKTHAASAAIFATYPLWLYLGYRRGNAKLPR